MDEVDSMLDTYGYRTGGRVGYAMGDRVDTDQIIEDFQRIPSIGQGIGNLARAGIDNIDKIIEVIIKTNPILATGDKIIEILVERYGVDPEVAQRKVINRMSDTNEGFGPQGPQGTPDEGYNPNIGIDAGAEDYYGETPAMPENLGDMGGNMDDMSGNSILNRIRRQGIERMPRPDRLPPIPMPEMQPDPDRLPPMPMPTMPRDPRYFEREGFEDGGETEEERAKRKRRKERRDRFTEGFDFAQDGLESLKELDDEIKPLPIRELRLARGGITDINVENDGTDINIDKEYGFGASEDAMNDAMQNQNNDLSGEMASNPEVMDSLNELSLMLFRRPLDQLSEDEYEELKDFAGQTSLKPGLIDEYRNYKYNAEEQGQTPMSPRDYFRMEFGAARMGVARGGIMDVNTNMELDIPGMGREDVDVNSMESIKGQTAGPEWYQERIENLEFLFGDELTDDEIADIAYDSDKYYDKVGYDPMKQGGSVKKPKVKSIGIGKAKDYPGIKKTLEMNKKGRKRYAEGGLMSMGGNEMDLRGGGFVPMGAKERADDVPARLSKNEFVMTADAVRGAGGGSVQKGADLMYDQMKRLEGQA